MRREEGREGGKKGKGSGEEEAEVFSLLHSQPEPYLSKGRRVRRGGA